METDKDRTAVSGLHSANDTNKSAADGVIHG